MNKEIMKNITFRTTETQIEDLKAKSNILNCSVSSIIRMALDNPDRLNRLIAAAKGES